jgi:hypothetical protein
MVSLIAHCAATSLPDYALGKAVQVASTVHQVVRQWCYQTPPHGAVGVPRQALDKEDTHR